MDENKNESEQLSLLPTGQHGDSSNELFTEKPQYKVYRRRWYVLAVFTAISLVCNFEWNTWGPIAQPCKIVFGWETWQVLLLTSLAAVSIILGSAPLTWLMDTRGLRFAVVFCSFCLTAGKALHVLPSSNTTTRTILINAGQVIAMFVAPIGFGAPPHISATWFPPNERNTATAIATLAAYVGMALSSAVGPVVVPVIGPTAYMNKSGSFFTEDDKQAMDTGIKSYMGLQLAISGFLFICTAAYFPDKPPTPPSVTAKVEVRVYKDQLRLIVTNCSYWLLVCVFAMSFGVYYGWFSVLSVAVKPFHIRESEAGWLGSSAVIAGVLIGIALARWADHLKRFTKHILIVMFGGTAVAQLVFSLTCSRLLPYSEVVLFGSIMLGGICFMGTTPLLFELVMECVYPVAEGATAIIPLAAGFTVYLAFQVTFMPPGMDVRWMNWFTVAATGICAPVLFFYKERYNRLEWDLCSPDADDDGEGKTYD